VAGWVAGWLAGWLAGWVGSDTYANLQGNSICNKNRDDHALGLKYLPYHSAGLL